MSTLISHNVDINSAIADEQSLPSGDYEVRFYILEPLTRQDVADARYYLRNQGVDVHRIYQGKEKGISYLGVKYTRHAAGDGISFLPIAIIPLIGFGMIAALIGIGLFKLEDLGKVMLIGGGLVIVTIALIRRPVEKYLERS